MTVNRRGVAGWMKFTHGDMSFRMLYVAANLASIVLTAAAPIKTGTWILGAEVHDFAQLAGAVHHESDAGEERRISSNATPQR